MGNLGFTFLVFGISGLAGFLGALTGLGGGVVITPALTLLLGVDLRYAMGASLVSVIATSSATAASYVKEGYSNIRIGMFLEIATTLGALLGAYLTGYISGGKLAIVFGLVLLQSAWQAHKTPVESNSQEASSPLAVSLKLPGSYPTPEGLQRYAVRGVPGGFSLMFGAGILSGLLGLGSGALKVIAMDRIMRIPFKVSTTTSNFMIGVTAAASATIYVERGYVNPALVMPVMLGVLAGSIIGARTLTHAPVHLLRWVFSAVIAALALEMIWGGYSGEIH